MRFEDGDEGDYTEEEMEEIISKMSIPSGGVGFRFDKKFLGGAVFHGTVTGKNWDKRVCEFLMILMITKDTHTQLRSWRNFRGHN